MPCASNSVRRPLALPGTAGSVMPRNSSGMRFSRPAALTAASAASACTSVSGVPPDLEVTTKRVAARVEGAERRLQRDGIEVVVEARARPLPLRLVRHAGDVPAAELRQRLAAEARAADAEEDDGVGARESLASAASAAADVRGLLGDAQVRQPARAVVLLQRRNRGRRAGRASGSAPPASAHACRWRPRGSRRSTAYREPCPSACPDRAHGREP